MLLNFLHLAFPLNFYLVNPMDISWNLNLKLLYIEGYYKQQLSTSQAEAISVPD